MNSELLVGVRINPLEKMNIFKMKNVDLTGKSESLKGEVANQINLSKDAFDLIYGGVVIDDETPLEAYGIKNGSLVHFLKRKEEAEPVPTVVGNDSEANVRMLTSVFQSFVGIPLLQLAMRHMTKRPEVIENIISSSPGLGEDAVAIAILHDPDLLVHFNNAETIRKMAKLHPALLEAAQHIASAVHEEAHNFAALANSQNNSSNPPTTGHSYSLENLSDDEEMAGDSSQSSDSPQASNSASQSRSQSDTRLTVSEFFAAIASANRRRSNGSGTGGGASTASSSSVTRSNSNSGGVITFEMFNEAMQQAFASTPVSNNDSSSSQPPSASFTPPTNTSNTGSGNSTDMQRQISIMHEMGLLNDAINLQALQVTNGDVQTAIELVLNGFGDNWE